MFGKAKTLNARPFELIVDRFLATDQNCSGTQLTALDKFPNWLPIGGDTWLFSGQHSAKTQVDILIDALTCEEYDHGLKG